MITLIIIVLTCIISFSAFSKSEVFDKLCLDPYLMHRKKGEYFRFISLGFVHADFGHLLLNMITLWFFGSQVERSIFTQTEFIIFYLSSLVLSSVHEYARQKNNEHYKACGASGAVSAVLFSLVLFQPWGVVYIKFIIPVYFILYAVFYVCYSLYMDRKQQDNVAHGVHLWGALYGIAFTLITKPESLSMFLAMIGKPPFL